VHPETCCCLWRDQKRRNEAHAAGDRHRPEVVEFSFRYGDDDEGYEGSAVLRAYEIFQSLQAPALADWVDPKGTTKTAFAYDYV
jgi:hypothetical protein